MNNPIEREKIILRNLQYDEAFMRKVMPFLKEDYFFAEADKTYFKQLQEYFNKYNKLPTHEEIVVGFQDLTGISQDTAKTVLQMSDNFKEEKQTPNNLNWLIDEAERFCQDKSLYLGMMEAIKIMDNSNKDRLSVTAIPEILSKATSITFDSKTGHHYLEGFDERFEFYNRQVDKIPSHLESLNRMMGGGAERKTINSVAAGTNVGKSIFMCDLAANYAKMGYNVLYVSLEMADLKIAQRIDANLMNVDINTFKEIPKLEWDKKVASVKATMKGKIVVKEYPTSSANASHIRFLLRELKQKNDFIPDVIFVDYINICSSVRYKDASKSYGYMKGVTEELRGLMVEHNCVGWTGVQFNRDGINNSDADMTNTGESMGIVHTLDFLLALIVTEDLARQGQVMMKQLKSRYGDVHTNNRLMIGLDKPKMRFFELNNNNAGLAMPPSAPTPQFNRPQRVMNTGTTQSNVKPTIKGVKI